MAVTRITDVIDPEILGAMVLEKLPNNTVLIPGVFTTSDFPIATEGTIWEIPFNELLGDLETYLAGIDLTAQALGQGDYKMVVIRKAAVYAADKIVKNAAFKDPMAFVSTQLATQTIPDMYMATQISIMEGGIPAANRYDGSAANMSADTVRIAKLKLGDKASNLKYILMHSKQFGNLERAKEVVYQRGGSILPLYETQVTDVGNPQAPNLIATVAGLIIFVSDNCPLDSTSPDVYVAYLMGDGAMGHFWQQQINIDLDRDIFAKEDYISPDLDFVMCIHGMDYTSALYTVVALETTANYTIKWDQKQIKLVRMITL